MTPTPVELGTMRLVLLMVAVEVILVAAAVPVVETLV
jgi:hypothetical protein